MIEVEQSHNEKYFKIPTPVFGDIHIKKKHNIPNTVHSLKFDTFFCKSFDDNIKIIEKNNPIVIATLMGTAQVKDKFIVLHIVRKIIIP